MNCETTTVKIYISLLMVLFGTCLAVAALAAAANASFFGYLAGIAAIALASVLLLAAAALAYFLWQALDRYIECISKTNCAEECGLRSLKNAINAAKITAGIVFSGIAIAALAILIPFLGAIPASALSAACGVAVIAFLNLWYFLDRTQSCIEKCTSGRASGGPDVFE